MSENHLPAVVTPNETPLAVRPFQNPQLLDPANLNVWTSLDPQLPAEKATIINLIQGGDSLSAGDCINEVFRVRHVLVHRVELLDEETGALEDVDRLVLVLDDGRTVAAVSRGMLSSVQLLCAAYGMPPWTPGLEVKVTQKNTRKGRRLYQLQPYVAPAAAEKSTSKRG